MGDLSVLRVSVVNFYFCLGVRLGGMASRRRFGSLLALGGTLTRSRYGDEFEDVEDVEGVRSQIPNLARPFRARKCVLVAVPQGVALGWPSAPRWGY